MMANLQTELENLYRNVARTDDQMAEMAEACWRAGGICCPSCGMPGYSDLIERQDRRWARIRIVEAKLVRKEAAHG